MTLRFMHIFDNFVNNVFFVDFMIQLIIIATTIITIMIMMMMTMMMIIITIIKSVSMRKPGRTRQEVIQLKSPILLKLGINVRFGE